MCPGAASSPKTVLSALGGGGSDSPACHRIMNFPWMNCCLSKPPGAILHLLNRLQVEPGFEQQQKENGNGSKPEVDLLNPLVFLFLGEAKNWPLDHLKLPASGLHITYSPDGKYTIVSPHMERQMTSPFSLPLICSAWNSCFSGLQLHNVAKLAGELWKMKFKKVTLPRSSKI